MALLQAIATEHARARYSALTRAPPASSQPSPHAGAWPLAGGSLGAASPDARRPRAQVGAASHHQAAQSRSSRTWSVVRASMGVGQSFDIRAADHERSCRPCSLRVAADRQGAVACWSHHRAVSMHHRQCSAVKRSLIPYTRGCQPLACASMSPASSWLRSMALRQRTKPLVELNFGAPPRFRIAPGARTTLQLVAGGVSDVLIPPLLAPCASDSVRYALGAMIRIEASKGPEEPDRAMSVLN